MNVLYDFVCEAREWGVIGGNRERKGSRLKSFTHLVGWLRAAPREVRDAFEPAALPLADPANHTPLSRFTDEVIQHVHRKPEAKL